MHGLSLASSVLPVLAIMKPERVTRKKKMQILFPYMDAERLKMNLLK